MWGIEATRNLSDLQRTISNAIKRLLKKAEETDASIATIQNTALPFLVPTGTVNMWPAATAPTGYLLCNGSAISRTGNAALFAVIGTTYGAGDGSTTFNVPNFTGLVPRMPGTQAISGRDKVGPALGTTQEDQHQRITGSLNNNAWRTTGTLSGAISGSTITNVAATGGAVAGLTQFDFNSANSPNARASATTDGETRVSSLGINFIIKL